MPFAAGKVSNPAGCPVGAHHIGRPTDAFKNKCQKMAMSPKAMKFIRAVIEGDPIEEKTLFVGTDKPVKVLVTASADVRARVWDRVAEKGFPKVSLVNEDGENVGMGLVLYLPEKGKGTVGRVIDAKQVIIKGNSPVVPESET